MAEAGRKSTLDQEIESVRLSGKNETERLAMLNQKGTKATKVHEVESTANVSASSNLRYFREPLGGLKHQ